MAPGKDGDRQATEADDKPTGVMTPLVLLVVFIITPFYIVAKTRSVSKEEPSNMYIYNVVRKKFSILICWSSTTRTSSSSHCKQKLFSP
jgi:hypothetical protein